MKKIYPFLITINKYFLLYSTFIEIFLKNFYKTNKNLVFLF